MSSNRHFAYQDQYNHRPARLSFRKLHNSDIEFIAALYASTRASEMDLVDWSVEQKLTFLRQQFDAQHKYYQQQFTQAQFLLIELDHQPCGRVYIDRRKEEIRLIDIAIVPELRGHGIGSALMKELIHEAETAQLPIRLHVEQFNPAFRLYQRLGFQILEDQGIYLLMEWQHHRDDAYQVNTAS